MKLVFFDSVSDKYGSSRIGRLIIEILSNSGFIVDSYVGVEHLNVEERYATLLDMPLFVMSKLKSAPILYLYNTIVSYVNLYKKFDHIADDNCIIYCNTLSTLPVGLIAKQKKIRCILHLHESANNSLIKYIGSRILPFLFDRIICVSTAVADSWNIREFSHVTVIHNGIMDLSNLEIRSLSVQRKFDVCFVGRLTEKKGIFLFIEALNLMDKFLANKNKRFSVAIAGGVVPGLASVESILSLISVKNIDVTYFGEVENTSEIFSASKVVCIPSLFKDPFPTVVLEGMRSGCSIVSSSFGGAREAMMGCHGELFDTVDSGLLAEILLRQCEKWNIQSLLNNRSIFLNKFTFEIFRKRLIGFSIDGL